VALRISRNPDRQITTIAQAFILLCPVRHPVPFLCKLVVTAGIEFMQHFATDLCNNVQYPP